MSLSIFPAELLYAICTHLPNYDLVSLASTNLSLCAIAQRLLYRHISIVLTAKNQGIVNTLASRSDVSGFVRTFSLTADENISSGVYQLLKTALEGMSELTSLDLLIGPSNSWVLAGLSNRFIPHLRHFACSFSFDGNVVKFLESTHEVTELAVNKTAASTLVGVLQFSSASIPHLKHFEGPSQVAGIVVPGRPVAALYLSTGVLEESTLPLLTKSTVPIILLDAIISTDLLSCLEAIATYLPSLSYLRLMTTYSFVDHPDLIFYETVSKLLSRIPRLISFELSGMNWTSSTANDASLSDGQRIWQSRPPTPRFPSSIDIREDDELLFGFSENLLVF